METELLRGKLPNQEIQQANGNDLCPTPPLDAHIATLVPR